VWSPMALRLAGLVLLAALLAAWALLDTASSVSCGGPDHDWAAGRLSIADQGYDAVLKRDPGAACAVKGRRVTRCELALDRFDAGRFTEAETNYRALLKLDPPAKCAAAGVETIADQRCTEADALVTAQLYEEAQKAYTALLTFEPRPYCVPKKVEKPDGEKKTPPPQPCCSCCCSTCVIDP
jgi:tetratricopeptide (TPR) repeat protein